MRRGGASLSGVTFGDNIMFGNSRLRTPRRRVFYGHRDENVPWCNFDRHIIFAETATTRGVIQCGLLLSCFRRKLYVGQNSTNCHFIPNIIKELCGRGRRYEYPCPVVTQHSISILRLLPASHLFLAWLILRPWRRRRHVDWLSTDYTTLHARRQNCENLESFNLNRGFSRIMCKLNCFKGTFSSHRSILKRNRVVKFAASY
jgi:hypothetical protein